MHGEGARRTCSECGQPVGHIPDILSHRELRGPRNITSSNIDRIFDDNGKRLLFIEEKHTNEQPASDGQKRLLRSIASQPNNTMWVAKGTPSHLQLFEIVPHGVNIIGEGDFDWYQQCVNDWYTTP